MDFLKLMLALFVMVMRTQANLLINGDFESGTVTGWDCMGSCSLTISSEAHSGSHSVKVTDRTAKWNGLSQNVDVTSGERYRLSAYVRLLNTANNAPYQTVTMMEKCFISGSAVYKRVGQTPHMVTGQWYEVGGLRLIAPGSENCKYYIQTEAPTDYLVDDVSLTLIPSSEWTEWASNTDARIDQLRKADLSVRLTGSGSEYSLLDIELEQTSMEFAMGSAVSAQKIVDSEYQAYQDVFYRNFEWGVLENALKWRQMEWNQGVIDESTPMDAMNAMISKGIKMRCHCVLWGVEDKNPNWVKQLSGQALQDAVDTRVSGVVNMTKGLCEEWDVNNEMLHGDFYASNTGNPSFTEDTFHDVRNLDPKPRLFLNDFNVISGPETTVTMKDTAMKYIAANVPLDAIGAQGHMTDVDNLLVKARLDIIAEAGLPIVITELSVEEPDVNVKAQKLADLMRIFFSHPAVDGVLLWGFWDGQIFEPDAALFSGVNVTANAAGRAYQDFFHNTWRTHTYQKLLGNQVYNTRAFKGDYRIKIKYNDTLLSTHTFTLTDAGRDIEIQVQGNPGGAPAVIQIA